MDIYFAILLNHVRTKFVFRTNILPKEHPSIFLSVMSSSITKNIVFLEMLQRNDALRK